jgi:hypothetical protein
MDDVRLLRSCPASGMLPVDGYYEELTRGRWIGGKRMGTVVYRWV